MFPTAWLVAPESTTKRVLDHAASPGSWPGLLLPGGRRKVASRQSVPVLPCVTAHATSS